MSIIYASGSAISRSALNTSSAKIMYSFSKAERFPKLSRKGFADTFYDLPSMKMKRYTKFGFGKKYDFTDDKRKYNSRYNDYSSDFNQNHPHGPRYTFSSGREKYGKVYLDSVKMLDLGVPGPALYNYIKPFGSDAPKYSMRSRNEKSEYLKKRLTFNKKQKKYHISNGYLIHAINSNGKYAPSNVRNINSIKMQYDKSKRSDFMINPFPGPAKYKIPQLLGKTIESQHKSYEPRSFLRRYKYKDDRENYPGPGSYMLPSDFGIYISKDADKYPKENVYPVKKIKFEEKAWRHGMKKIKNQKEKKEENKNEVKE